jgi:HNH endonuclease
MNEALRAAVAARARGRCEYCGLPMDYSSATFEVDHIHPRAAQGSDDLSNLAWACPACNDHKAAATQAPDPDSGLLVTLFHLRQDNWAEHFRWSQDGFSVEGITPTGRATVQRLQMNRTPSVNLRRILAAFDLHP